mmetsp:Transcript_12133/g.23446  ORF Transcript_12133/g.23446 Transcript_12133/m.23446 type:complete len:309 (-) Transcript_12133:49-975(-)
MNGRKQTEKRGILSSSAQSGANHERETEPYKSPPISPTTPSRHTSSLPPHKTFMHGVWPLACSKSKRAGLHGTERPALHSFFSFLPSFAYINEETPFLHGGQAKVHSATTKQRQPINSLPFCCVFIVRLRGGGVPPRVNSQSTDLSFERVCEREVALNAKRQFRSKRKRKRKQHLSSDLHADRGAFAVPARAAPLLFRHSLAEAGTCKQAHRQRPWQPTASFAQSLGGPSSLTLPRLSLHSFHPTPFLDRPEIFSLPLKILQELPFARPWNGNEGKEGKGKGRKEGVSVWLSKLSLREGGPTPTRLSS